MIQFTPSRLYDTLYHVTHCVIPALPCVTSPAIAAISPASSCSHRTPVDAAHHPDTESSAASEMKHVGCVPLAVNRSDGFVVDIAHPPPNVPAGHGWQCVADAANENVPRAHSSHRIAPLAVLKVPAKHPLQFCASGAPIILEKVPASQSSQRLLRGIEA